MRSWRISFIRNKGPRGALLAGLCLLAVLSALGSLCLGAEDLPLGEVLRALSGGTAETAAERIVRYARLPRTCGCLLAGAAPAGPWAGG